MHQGLGTWQHQVLPAAQGKGLRDTLFFFGFHLTKLNTAFAVTSCHKHPSHISRIQKKITTSAKITLRNLWYLVCAIQQSCKSYETLSWTQAKNGRDIIKPNILHLLHKIKLILRTLLNEKRPLFSSELHYTEVLALPIIHRTRTCQPLTEISFLAKNALYIFVVLHLTAHRSSCWHKSNSTISQLLTSCSDSLFWAHGRLI